MKKIIYLIVLVLFSGQLIWAQEEAPVEKKVDKPVRSPWESGTLVNHQTSVTQYKNTLEMVISHRFGPVENGISDVFGIMAPGANIRIGFNYTILDDLSVGFGTNSQKKYQDFQAKYTPFQQTRENTIPVSLTIYGNAAIDARAEETFGVNYEFTDRLSYFSEVIVGRKVNDWLSVQASANFTHYNAVDTLLDNDKMGLGFGGRVKFSPQSSLTLEVGVPLKIESLSQYSSFTDHPKPHFSIGYEVSTSTHAFQIFVTNGLGILPQELYMFNLSEFDAKSIRFGFNITRLWNF
ncbi:DUF5777 family beta-barrel protein [Carboxylicivirga sp. M1479]|uniref:DUF5777 family beta-barrel protein n=1 Tax=Carboxylicivirga sp. M1479 TaxID=2594476 RepID=UPI0011785DCA|nr:DUF5777 family beta-barrel protein [Carboxylicivirga sp. M1479]TRX71912.1 hypothetical protein FNN09_04630 [Carboxylicivirga sp. M1479]